TGHIEVVQIDFDEDGISYAAILSIFFKTLDPTDTGGQFADRGSQYMPATLYHDEQQKETAEKVIEEIDNSSGFDKPIKTPVMALESFYEAEEEHQDCYKKNRGHYNAYYKGSGRKAFIENHWGE